MAIRVREPREPFKYRACDKSIEMSLSGISSLSSSQNGVGCANTPDRTRCIAGAQYVSGVGFARPASFSVPRLSGLTVARLPPTRHASLDPLNESPFFSDSVPYRASRGASARLSRLACLEKSTGALLVRELAEIFDPQFRQMAYLFLEEN
jgi:hypothetical protein